MSDEPAKPSPLKTAAERARESMVILADYLKIAVEIHAPDEYRPAILAMDKLCGALDDIQNLRHGIGASGGFHSGHISAE